MATAKKKSAKGSSSQAKKSKSAVAKGAKNKAKTKTKTTKQTPCWEGFERVPGTQTGAKGSCRKR